MKWSGQSVNGSKKKNIIKIAHKNKNIFIYAQRCQKGDLIKIYMMILKLDQNFISKSLNIWSALADKTFAWRNILFIENCVVQENTKTFLIIL